MSARRIPRMVTRRIMVRSGSKAEWTENFFHDWLERLSTDLRLALPPNLLSQMWAGRGSYFHCLQFVPREATAWPWAPPRWPWALGDGLLTEAGPG